MEQIKAMYKKFMSGFSYIIPLAVIGGVFLTLYNRFDEHMVLFDFGTFAFILIYPILAGFIAYSISDKPGFILGLLAGFASILSGGGFLSATLLGFLAGYIIIIFNYIFKKMPYGFKGLKPVFIYPVLGAFILFFVIQGFEFTIFPVEEWIRNSYSNLDKNIILVSAGFLGLMMAYDLGGPINKIAYVIAVLTIFNAKGSLLAPAIMIAGMMPPLVIASSAFMFRNKYSHDDQRLAKSNWLLGLSFITEGAIPFVNNKRTKFVILISSMTAAVLTVLFDVSSLVVHGGILSVVFMRNAFSFLLILLGSTLFFGVILGIILPRNEQ